MRRIEVKEGDLIIKEKVRMVYEKNVTPFGNSGKVGVPKEFIGKRVYVIVLED